jgi:hypothetical protein
MLSTAKVVIVVGATGSATQNYREIADAAYAEAIQYTPNVVRVYSPNATWSAVKAALQGASIVIYLGHGNGWPSPYGNDPSYTTKDGFGLNATANNGDNNVTYYGEPYLAGQVKLAPNAVVLLNHLCYSAGNSEPGNPDPTLAVAKQRADNYGAGFIKAGARAVIAEAHGSINGMIRDLFTTNETVLDLWRNQGDYNGNEFSFPSVRSPGYTTFMDPVTPTGGYFRSLVGDPTLQAGAVTGPPAPPSTVVPAPPASSGTATAGGAGTVTRLAGSNRYATAAAISAATFAPGVPIAYVTTGLSLSTGLAGAAAAGAGGAPILLVSPTVIPSATAAELSRLQPGRIVVLGTAGAVSDAVVAALAAYTTGTVTRLAGSNRYATAAAISAATFAPGVPIAYVTTGLSLSTGLAGAAAAGAGGAPILLVSPTVIPSATAAELSRLQPGRIVVLGTAGAVSDAVVAALAAYTTG